MADLRKTIQIIFGATDNVSGVASNIQQQLSSFKSGVTQIADPFADMANSVLKTEAALIGMGAAFGTYAISKAVDAESAIKSLQKVLGDGEDDIEAYKNQMQDLALTFATANTDVIDATTNFKQAGFTIKESLELTESALTAVRIAELSSAEASSYLIATIRGLGVEASYASHILDAWNEVSNNNATSVRELAEATSSLAPLARSAGFSFDELVGVVTPMIEVLRSGSESANALKVSFARLTDDSKSTVSSLESIGVEQQKANGEFKSAKEILTEVALKWGDLSLSQQATFAQTVFGKEQYARMMIVLNDYNKTLAVTETATNSLGSAQKELDVAMGKTETILDRIKVAFDILSSSIGDEFLAETALLGGSLTNIAKALLEVVRSPSLEPIFDAISESMVTLSGNINNVAKNLPEAFSKVDFSGLIDSFGRLGDAFGDAFGLIFGDVDLTNADDIAGAIQKMVNVFESLTNISAGIIQQFNPFFELLGLLGEASGEASREAEESIGRFLGAAKAIADFGVEFGLAMAAITSTDSSVGVVLNNLVEAGKIVFNILDSAAKALVSSVFLVIGNLNKALATVTFGDLAKDFEAKAEAATATAKDLGNGILENFSDISNSFDSFGKNIFDIGDKTKNTFGVIDKGINDTKDSTKQLTDEQINHNRKLEETKQIQAEQRQYAQELALAEINAQAKVAESTALIKAQAIETRAEVAKTELQLRELSSKNYIATLELQGKNFEEETKRLDKVFSSLDNTVTSTGNVISSSFDDWSDTDWVKNLAIRDTVRREQEDRRRALELQERMTASQIKYFDAKAKYMEQGLSEISISADGLEPELEAFMWAILDRVRLRATQDQANFLIGIS